MKEINSGAMNLPCIEMSMHSFMEDEIHNIQAHEVFHYNFLKISNIKASNIFSDTYC